VVDELTGKKWLDFTVTKKEMPDQMCKWLNIMKANAKPIPNVRMDPGGKNIALEKLVTVAEWKNLQPIKFEVTSRETPQHNNLAELAFPYIAWIARAMMASGECTWRCKRKGGAGGTNLRLHARLFSRCQVE